MSFVRFGLDDKLKVNIDQYYLKTPTYFQLQAIPKLLDADMKRCLLSAPKSSGKVIAFAIALISYHVSKPHTADKRPPRTPSSIIIVPSRKSLVLVREVMQQLSKGYRYSVDCVHDQTSLQTFSTQESSTHFLIVTSAFAGDIMELDIPAEGLDAVVLHGTSALRAEADRISNVTAYHTKYPDAKLILTAHPGDVAAHDYARSFGPITEASVTSDFAPLFHQKHLVMTPPAPTGTDERTDQMAAVLAQVLQDDHCEKALIVVPSHELAERLLKYLDDVIPTPGATSIVNVFSEQKAGPKGTWVDRIASRVAKKTLKAVLVPSNQVTMLPSLPLSHVIIFGWKSERTADDYVNIAKQGYSAEDDTAADVIIIEAAPFAHRTELAKDGVPFVDITMPSMPTDLKTLPEAAIPGAVRGGGRYGGRPQTAPRGQGRGGRGRGGPNPNPNPTQGRGQGRDRSGPRPSTATGQARGRGQRGRGTRAQETAKQVWDRKAAQGPGGK